MTKDKTTIEKEISDEIRGIKHPGMLGGMVYAAFREDYYEKLSDLHEKKIAVEILLTFLKNENFDPGFRTKVAWICDDIGIFEAEGEIQKLGKDKNIKESNYSTGIKAVLNHIELEKKIVKEIQQINSAIGKQSSNEIYNKAVALYRKLRGDISRMYGSKDVYEKSEEELSRIVVSDILKKIIRSEKYDDDLKAKVQVLLSDIKL